MRKKNNFYEKINIVYICTMLISGILIKCSFNSNLDEMWATICVSIGCSGIAAAVMSIFLDLRNARKDKRKKEELRKVFLFGLYHELQHLFERVVWFDRVFDKLKLEKEIDYYMTTDFIKEAYECDCYEATSIEKCKDEIKNIIEKYNNDEWKKSDNDSYKKIEKMFRIIGEASNLVSYEHDIIKRNQMFLVANEIFSTEELRSISTNIDKFVEFLKTPKTNYSTALVFLLDGYLEIHNMGAFKQEMFIYWQPPKSIVDMVIEERRKKEIIPGKQIGLKDRKKDSKNKRRNKGKKNKLKR